MALCKIRIVPATNHQCTMNVEEVRETRDLDEGLLSKDHGSMLIASHFPRMDHGFTDKEGRVSRRKSDCRSEKMTIFPSSFSHPR